MNNDMKYEFKGGVWMGLWANSWPFGSLKIDEKEILLRDEMIKKEYRFQKNEVDKVVSKKFFPILGYGIRIYPKGKSIPLYFWVGGQTRFSQLTKIMKALNYPLDLT